MILESENLLNDFSRQFNTRLTPLDFLNGADLLVRMLNQKDTKSPISAIWLPCYDTKIYQQLKSFRYVELLSAILSRIQVNDESKDIFISEMDENLLNIYKDFITQAKVNSLIKANDKENKFEIINTELFIDLTISPFGQLHMEVVTQLKYFNRLIALNSQTAPHPNYTDNLYIQSRLPSPYSYFLLAFIAENLNIKLHL